jgi:hypothetical protein
LLFDIVGFAAERLDHIAAPAKTSKIDKTRSFETSQQRIAAGDKTLRL